MKSKKCKRASGLLLAAILICAGLTGCSNDGAGGNGEGSESSSKGDQGKEESARGRFLEEELDTGGKFDYVLDMGRMEDGRLRLVAQSGINSSVWQLADDGKNLDKVYDFPEELQASANGSISCAALSPDGQIVCEFTEYGTDDYHSVLYLIDKEGKANKLPFELPELEEDKNWAEDEEMSNQVEDLQFPVNDQVVLQDRNGTVFQIDAADGSVKHEYEMDSAMFPFYMFAMGNTLVLQSGDQVILYDMETGEQKQAEETLSSEGAKSGGYREMDTLDGGESIYCLSAGGLYYYKFGGSIMEQLIDGSMNTLGTPDFYPMAMAMLDEQNLLVAAHGDSGTEGMVLYKYTYSADVPLKPDKELKIYSLYDDETIREIINRFRKEHSDVNVNYQAALSEDNGMTVSDALKTLTTEIMAGNGPDVLLLDGMPIQTYIEKGVLKDLSQLLKETGGSYFENITNAYQDDQGQLCAVPSRFLIPMIQAGSKYYSPGEDFDTFMERKDTMVNMRPPNVVGKFWYTCGAAWQQEDGTLDEAKVTEFLVKLKHGYGQYDSSIEEYDYNREPMESMLLFYGDYELLNGNWNTNFGLCGYKDYGFEVAINEKVTDGYVDLMPGQADHVFVPTMVLGISSKSSQPELAGEFVKYLLSPNAAQDIFTQFSGFPVEKGAFRSAIDGHKYEKNENNITSQLHDGDAIEYTQAPTPEEEITRMTELAESLTTPSLQDDVIKEAVVEQGVKVLKGELSPEEGAAAIMQKVNIYLAE